MAPVMAAIAMAESSGNPNATDNDSNGTTDRGLWQINSTWGDLSSYNPLFNAEAAVEVLSQQGLSAWVTYNNGNYKQFLQGGGSVSTDASVTTDAATASNPTTGQSPTSTTLSPTDALKDMGALLHGIAQGLNWAFWVFQPGQGWRFLFGVGGVASGVGAAKLYMSPNVQQEKSAAFPLAILLTGTSFLFLYMTLRAWPQNNNQEAIRPSAYMWMIISGQKPPAGPTPPDNTGVIETGLVAIASIWVVNKAAGAIGNIAGAAGVLGQIWNGLKKIFTGGGGEGGGEPIPPIEGDIPVASFTVNSYPGLSNGNS